MTSKSGASSDSETVPTVAVIITNWNYGHFLAGCIACVLAQTTRPDEIIVVDDGSTDGSLAVLADYADRVQVVRQPNGGQASAFNAGFARSTSAIILFLDADDLLRPEAIETIVTWWRPGLTSLSFWLELIDVGGRSRGIYEETLRVDEGDKRQRLITRGVFAFAPTSGNAFSRAFLETFLPLDEVRWGISADLPLTYAAALHGPHAVIPQALGAYRTHGSNNYYRERLPDAWRLHRGMRDVADALALLADRQRGRVGDDEALLGLALRFAALRMQVKLQMLEGNRGDLADHARRHLRNVLASTLPRGLRLLAAAPFAVLGAGGWRWAWLRRWIADPRTRPAPIQAVAAALRERRPDGLLARARRLQRPRWHALVPFETVFAPDFNGLAASLMADGWSGEMSQTLHWSRGPKACLEFRLDPHPHALRLELSLVLCPALKGVAVTMETALGRRRLTHDHLTDHGLVIVDLSREMLEASPFLRLELACAVLSPRRAGWRTMFAPAPFFAIRFLRVRALDRPPSFPLLMPGVLHRFGSLLTSEKESAWHVDPAGIAWILHSEATCHIAVAPFARPVALALTLAQSEAHGWLRITCGDRPLFSGTVVPGAELHCALAPVASPDDTGLDLVFSFTANDPTDLAKLGIATIGLVTLGAATASEPSKPDQPLRLNIGERVALEGAAATRFASGQGWEIDDPSGLANVETEASFALGIPPDCRDPVLHLALEPLLPEPDDHHHIVAVSVDQDVLVSARLQGIGSLDIPVPAAAIGTDGVLTMTLHSIFVADATTDLEPALPLFAGVRLRAVSLTARAAARHAETAPWVHAYAGSRLHELALEAKAVITGERPQGRDALRALRARFASAIWSTDKRGIESQLMVPGFVDDLEGLGALAAWLPLGPDETSLVAAMETNAAGPGVLLRHMLCAMVLRIVPRDPALSDLRHLPAPLLWSPHPLARYLARKRYGHGSPASGLGGYWETLLTHLLDTLRHEPQTSVRYRVAVEILEQFAPTLDGSVLERPIPRLWARGVELHLSRSGCRLAASPPPRAARPRLRIGLLIHETSPGPETGIALWIGRALDRHRFEPVLIAVTAARGGLDMSAAFDTVVDLMDGTVERSAGTIRHLDLDILLIAAIPRGLDAIATLAAHSLAPVQMVVSKDWSLAAGLRSLAAADPSGWTASSRAGDAVPLPCLDAVAFAATAPDLSKGRDPQLSQSTSGVLVANASDLQDHWPLAALWVRILAKCPEAELIIGIDPVSADPAPEAVLIQGVIGMECADLHVAQSRVRFVDRRAIGADVMGTPDLALGFFGPNTNHLLKVYDAGVPFVALANPGTSLGADVWAACLNTAGLTATSPEAYVHAAVALAGDAARRAQRLAEIQRALAPGEGATDGKTALAFNAVLLKIAIDHGLVEMADED